MFEKLFRVIKKLGHATCLRYNRAHGAPDSRGKEDKNLLFSEGVRRYKDFVCNYFAHLSVLFKMISQKAKQSFLLSLTLTSKKLY